MASKVRPEQRELLRALVASFDADAAQQTPQARAARERAAERILARPVREGAQREEDVLARFKE